MSENSNNLTNNSQKKGVSAVDFFCIGFGAIVGVGWAVAIKIIKEAQKEVLPDGKEKAVQSVTKSFGGDLTVMVGGFSQSQTSQNAVDVLIGFKTRTYT